MSSSPSSPTMTLADEQSALDANIHPDYDFDDADLVLRSSDGTMFRVHSSIMRLVSSVFKDMLAVKRADGDGPITLDESKDTLETLLDTIYPTRRPASVMSISCFRLVAIAAEKYDMISVTNTLKDFILGRNSTTTLLSLTLPILAATQYTAIEEYLITSDLGWTAVSNELSAKTLTCDLNSVIAQGSLFSGNGPAARNLFSLHRKRRIMMYNSLARLAMNDSGLMGSYEEQSAYKSMIYSISPSPTMLDLRHNPHCSILKTWSESHLWWRFKALVFSMLETDVSGTQFLTDDFYRRSELVALLTCPFCKCNLSANERVLKDHFKLMVERIPRTIEEFQVRSLEIKKKIRLV